jgi:FKBP-type peptidyl-prolyl cis-trans isomerase SlpA
LFYVCFFLKKKALKRKPKPLSTNQSQAQEGAANPIVFIQENSFITLHYRIALGKLDQGEILVSTFESKPATLQLGVGQLAEGLEQCLLGLAQGDHQVFDIPPEKAYGERNAALIQRVSSNLLNQFAKPDTHLDVVGQGSVLNEFNVGDFVQFPAPNGGQYAGTVLSIEPDVVVFDFNHPLAGKPLVFEAKIIGVMQG